jgi:hypothetical protein
MSTDVFRRYAEEALREAVQSKNEKEQSASTSMYAMKTSSPCEVNWKRRTS